MLFYHATSYENLGSIMSKGIEPRGIEKVVYLCKTPEDAAKFLLIRGIKDIVSFAVELDLEDIEESFDHNISFFKCKAYTYDKKITPDMINLEKSRHFEL